MATYKTIELRIGRTRTITTEISGVDNLDTKSAVLYIARDYDSEPVLSKVGTVVSGTSEASFDLSASETIELSGDYKYEITIYEDDGSFVRDVNYGDIIVKPVINKDPTV